MTGATRENPGAHAHSCFRAMTIKQRWRVLRRLDWLIDERAPKSEFDMQRLMVEAVQREYAAILTSGMCGVLR